MLDSTDKDFPKRWATITELCEMGATRALVDQRIRDGMVFTLVRGRDVWYSIDGGLEEALAADAARRLGDESSKALDADLPRCNFTGNLHR